MSDHPKSPEETLAKLQSISDRMQEEFAALGLPEIDEDFDEAALHKDYPPLLRAVIDCEGAALVSALRRLLDEGATVDAVSPFGETALSMCLQGDEWAAARVLVEYGADIGAAGLTAGDVAVLCGEAGMLDDAALMARGARGLTPFLFAVRIGDLEAAKTLALRTPEAGRTNPDEGETPVHIAARSGAAAMLEWALEVNGDVDVRNRDGETPLLIAVARDDVDIARFLLERGADTTAAYNSSAAVRRLDEARPETGLPSAMEGLMAELGATLDLSNDDMIEGVMDKCHTPEMARLLATYGAPVVALNGVFGEEGLFPAAVGLDRLPPTPISPEMFYAEARPRHGDANPERVDIPFWREQMRTGRTGFAARSDIIGIEEDAPEPIWSFQRYGRTATRLEDGRWILIAGEHEDATDPDFKIYADVTVAHPSGEVDHYVYPPEWFPPTDFHTATLLDKQILIIGNLGYREQRREGVTQVLALDLSDFSVGQVATTGANPGWIHRHDAVLDGARIVISGGKIEPGFKDNEDVFSLDLETLVWRRETIS